MKTETKRPKIRTPQFAAPSGYCAPWQPKKQMTLAEEIAAILAK